jgi:Predicted membrane protein (DUF2232)
MMQRIGIAIGAGFAAALLFAVVAKGTLLAFLLACLAPLPIMIVALGWGLDMGAVAAASASVVAFGLVDPLSAATFAASTALPAWILSFLSLLPRERIFSRAAPAAGDSWFPAGKIVAVAALIGALFGAISVALLALVHGGYQQGVDAVVAQATPDLKDMFDGVMTLPPGMTFEDVVSISVRMSPAILAAWTLLTLCANLYAAARAVQLSQRLKRPWPNLPEAMVLPQALGAGLFVCAGLSLALRGAPAHLAWIGFAVLGCCYVMQGLAVVHALTRKLPARAPIMVAIYLGCAVLTPVSLPTLMLIGLAESLLSLRARRAAAANVKS